MKVALSTQVCREWDVEHSLRTAARIGYDGIELLIWEPVTTVEKVQPVIAEMKSLAARLGVEVPVLTLGDAITQYAAQPAYWRSFVQVAAGLGAGIVKTPAAPPSSREASDADFQAAALAARQCGQVAAEHGLKLACETHMGMVTNSIAGTLRFLEYAACDDVYLTLDVCNLYVNGDDQLAVGEALAERTVLLHVKDGKRVGSEAWSWHPLGLGEMDWAAVLARLDKLGYRGWASIECLLFHDDYVHVDSPNCTDPEAIAAHDLRVFREAVAASAETER